MKPARKALMICVMVGLIASALISSCVSEGNKCSTIIAFARTEKTTGTTDIFTMNEDGTDQTNMSNWSDAFDDTWGICFSPIGEKITFDVENYTTDDIDICLVNTDGSNLENITNTTGADDEFPAWLLWISEK